MIHGQGRGRDPESRNHVSRASPTSARRVCQSSRRRCTCCALPTQVYLLRAPEPLQPPALDSAGEMPELPADTAPVRIRRPAAPLLPRTYLEPVPAPGFHLHPLPRLATTAGVVIATDAGPPRVKERKEARGVEAIPDEGPGTTAAGVSAKPQGGHNTASIRAPATAQEGEATALLHHSYRCPAMEARYGSWSTLTGQRSLYAPTPRGAGPGGP